MARVRFYQSDGGFTEIQARVGRSLMENAKEAAIDGILAECGGSMVCGTCHVFVAEPWGSRLSPPDEIEEAVLECVAHPRPDARLSCQILLVDELDGLEVTVPPSQH